MAMVLLGMNVHGQEWWRATGNMGDRSDRSTTDWKPLVIGCRAIPSRSSAVSLEVGQAWLMGSALFADLLVTNGSESVIRLPRQNQCQRYWLARFDPSAYRAEESLSACAGLHVVPDPCDTVGFFGDPLETLLAEEDIETIAPGRTALLRKVYLGQFVADLRTPARTMQSFEVIYTGSSRIDVSIPAASLARYKTALEEASARQCSLYGGVLTGRGQFPIR